MNRKENEMEKRMREDGMEEGGIEDCVMGYSLLALLDLVLSCYHLILTIRPYKDQINLNFK